MQLKRIMQNILRNTVDYYSKGDRRALDINGICQCSCNGNRCAVGRLLTKGEAFRMKPGSVGAFSVNRGMPDRLKFLPLGFLVDLQNLHDERRNWNEDRLTETGQDKVMEIKVEIESAYNGSTDEWDD